ncbi:UNVERIFIED_CONTAM: hypothetical protein PYX00_002061 [Menopon gallinae]|uniref:Protein sleepless n=1 Tax=Menopon gallinae TaxID=328185 RepID=A0AAW2IF51_9NEOP
MAGISYLGVCAVGLIILGFLSSKAYTISCYSCNSQYDPNCGDPFNPFSIGIANCSLYPKPEHISDYEAKLCRKIVQKIQGSVRVIRSCGYIEDAEKDDKMCVKRSGTHDVHVDYCSCTGELCNKSNNLSSNFHYVIASVIIGICFGVNAFKSYETLYTLL